MIFKGIPGTAIICDKKRVGIFDDKGYMDVTNELHILRMKKAGYEQFKKLIPCKICGQEFETSAEIATHTRKEHPKNDG